GQSTGPQPTACIASCTAARMALTLPLPPNSTTNRPPVLAPAKRRGPTNWAPHTAWHPRPCYHFPLSYREGCEQSEPSPVRSRWFPDKTPCHHRVAPQIIDPLDHVIEHRRQEDAEQRHAEHAGEHRRA